MGVYEELKARGLIAQVTNEEEIREVVNSGKAVFYIGFDCTACLLYTSEGERTFTQVQELDFEGRKREVARIIGGDQITDLQLKMAEEMLRKG